MDVILPIKPIFVKKILSGEKIYEFRKSIFKQSVRYIYIYASYPVKRIVGKFTYTGCISGNKEFVWEQTAEYAGITRKKFDEYFNNHSVAYAIIINNLIVFGDFIDPTIYDEKFKAPQSYMYVKEGFINA